MTRTATGRKPWPLLGRYRADVAVLLGTVAFLAVVCSIGLWLVRSH